jgi:lysophospholipase L1-like esterase
VTKKIEDVVREIQCRAASRPGLRGRNLRRGEVSALLLAVGFAAGCGSSSAGVAGSNDSGISDAEVTGPDVSAPSDGGVADSPPTTDSSPPDSGVIDSSAPDSSAPDSSAPVDSGVPPTDSGSLPEAAPADAALVPLDPANLSKCTGTNPIACHFGGPSGDGTPGFQANYDVTVELGGATAGDTSVQAEISRGMLAPVATQAGDTAIYNMVVNVRYPEGQPVADLTGAASMPTGLDMYFWPGAGGPALLKGIGYAPAVAPIVVYLATDSTGCDQFDTAFAGWGQWLPQYFDAPITIANYGNSGVDTPGFAGGGSYWGAIEKVITANDYLLIELGDNDKTDSATSITNGLDTMITGARAKGATPILMTPANRAIFKGDVVQPYTTGNVPTIMAQVAAAQKVTLLDLTTRTTTWIMGLGPTGYPPYFAPGENDHFDPAGASIVAGFVRDLIKAPTSGPALPGLAKYAR